jgi:thiosulfate/3-mercaptopyruvate sulfurtransferase
MSRSTFVNSGRIAFLGVVCGLAAAAFGIALWAQSGSAASIPDSALLQPQELNRALHSTNGARPVILQVGSRVMFQEAHIPGSEYGGQASGEAGLSLLRKRAAGLEHATPIVIYCGCCPWMRCPNIGPAYKTLLRMGFTNVKALYLADNFGTDWVDKGYPVEGSH